MGFFSNSGSKLSIDPISPPEDGEQGLRKCQLGAFWALKGHFTSNEEPAIVSIPTGGGKTALMIFSAFLMDGDQILVVTPSNYLRRQTETKFLDLDGLGPAAADVLRSDIGSPSVAVVEEQVTEESRWEELLEHDVVVALPDNVSTEYDDDIVLPPTDDIDMAFFDEAHHTRADSWKQLVDHLDVEGVKEVLLTATPFRRDRRSLPGRLVYHYPVGRAISDGIYEEIEYLPVDVSFDEDLDTRLCEAAADRLETVNEGRPMDERLQILAKVREQDDADDLSESYREAGLDVKPIHSGRDEDWNDEVKDELDSGEIDGIVAVGMMGEGIDHDNLSVAVMHDPPKSFPLTLQLFGRIARPVEGASAAVIADPTELDNRNTREVVQRLYRQSDGWGDLITDLIEDVLYEDTGFGIRTEPVFGIPVTDIQPYFSVNLYDISKSWRSVDQDAEIPIPRGRLERFETGQNNLICMMTRTRQSPDWTAGAGPTEYQHDLHVYYYHHGSDILFEHTTSDRLAQKIRLGIIDGASDPIRGAPLSSILDENDLDQYLTAGLRGGPEAAGGAPDYKMYMGKRSENALAPTDRDMFAHGHSFTRLAGGDIQEESDVTTLGVSDRQGSIWSSNRDSLTEFKSWCQQVARSIDLNAEFDRISGLGLQVTEDIDRFPTSDDVDIELLYVGLDFQADFDEIKYKHRDDDRFRPSDDPGFVVVKEDVGGEARTSVEFYPTPDADAIDCEYSVGWDRWDGEIENYRFKIDPGIEADAVEMSSGQFMDQYAPEFFLSDGTVVKHGRAFERELGRANFPSSCFDKSEDIDWSECDRTAESNDSDVADGKQSLHDWTESHVDDPETDDQIIFKDHGSGEIADFVEIDSTERRISFYHCKVTTKSDGDEPSIGAAQKHVKDALYQLHRTLNWVGNPGLPNRIDDRRNNKSRHLVKGEDIYEDFSDDFQPGKWSYEVVLVNPCLDYDAALEDEKVDMILRACYESLDVDGADVDFRIIGHWEEQ
jgi:superfamily II DNA or RNA helicase